MTTIWSERTNAGVCYTNVSDVAQLVTVVDGEFAPGVSMEDVAKRFVEFGFHMPPPAFGRLSRIARSIIEPMKSWTIDVSHSAKMTSSPDLSPAQGKVTIIGGESKDA